MITAADDFDAFVRARTPALLRTAFLLTGDQHRAEDLVQDALIRTHRAWARLRESNPDAYTRKVMYHLNISWWRRGGTAELPTEHIPDRGAPARSDETISKIALRTAIAQLTSKQRAVIVLRFFEDVTEAEAADLLGVTVGTIKSQTSKALARLRTLAPDLLDAEAVGRSVDVSNVDLRDKVLQGSRRITVRNRVAGSVAAVLVLASAVITFGLLSNGNNVTPPVESPSPDTSPSTSTPPSPSAAPGPKFVGDIRNATLDIPAFPGGWATTCPAGRRTFVNGNVDVAPGGPPSLSISAPVVGEVDGQPGEELVATISCNDVSSSESNILAFRVTGAGGLSPIGFVLPPGISRNGEPFKIVDGRVLVQMLHQNSSALELQERGYALQGNAFTQVSGSTSFPALQSDVRKITFQDMTAAITWSFADGTWVSGYVKLVNGSGTANLTRYRPQDRAEPIAEGISSYTIVVKQVVYVKTNDWNADGAAEVLMEITGPEGTVKRVMQYKRMLEGYQNPAALAHSQLETGKNGVTNIESLEGGDFVTVTVQTSSGQERWKYRVEGEIWTKV
jgi:RNA polymerase sigma-70 factor (sigma-E family)